jgi:hypothetical protein
MILASHIIVSGLLGAETRNYFLAAILGIISHYILDGIPHWNYLTDEFELRAKTETGFIKSKKFWQEIIKVGADILIGVALLFVFLRPFSYANIFPAAISIFFGILPDPLNLLYWITNWKMLKWNSDLQHFMHYSIHKKIKQGFWPGITIQIATVGMVFLILYLF